MGRVWCPSMLKSHLLQEASPAACNSPLAQFRLLCCMGLGLGFGAFLAVEARAALNWNLHRDLHLMACGRRCPATGNVSPLFKHALGVVCLPAVEALLAHSSWAPSNRCFLSLLDICCNAPASMSDDGAMVALQAWFCSSLCGLPSPSSQAMYEY